MAIGCYVAVPIVAPIVLCGFYSVISYLDQQDAPERMKAWNFKHIVNVKTIRGGRLSYVQTSMDFRMPFKPFL